jgi:hypothetical protein
MSNPTAADPSPSLSAADLRRRLLASTPPQPAGTGDGPPAAVSSFGQGADSLAKLRLPGQADDAGPPAGGDVTTTPGPRRTPVVGLRPSDPGSVAGVAGLPGSGVIRQPGSGGVRPPAARPGDSADVDRLKAENKELRKLLKEMKQLLQEASDTEQQAAAREQEFRDALAEKQRRVEEMAAQLQAVEEQISTGALAPQQPAGPPKTRTELEEWADELEKEQAKLTQERKRFEDDRQQLREDEESLEGQMRQMEVSMARERAVMARQEQELKRLQAEIEQNLDLMQRGDAGLRDQMQKFQRRAADVMQGGPPRR